MAPGTRLYHTRFGMCICDRLEGDDWVLRTVRDSRPIRVTIPQRKDYQVVGESRTPAPLDSAFPDKSSGSGDRTIAANAARAGQQAPTARLEGRRARLAIETLRTGLTPAASDVQLLAVGLGKLSPTIGKFLSEVRRGGSAMVVRGQYGQGKTFSLKLLAAQALAANFAVVTTEINSHETSLAKPHHVYRDLLCNLRLPGQSQQGTEVLASAATALLTREIGGPRSAFDPCIARYQWLKPRLTCDPLTWLLSDPQIMSKPDLLGLLSCDPAIRVPSARRSHVWETDDHWPNFGASTQGDFASYLLSGIGRLCKVLGLGGLVIAIDEMEKWQDLNWNEQTKAGNLLGGLIWGATAREGHRQDHQRPPVLGHSGHCKRHPFTTEKCPHMGVVVAMTNRGLDGPEEQWQKYGPLTFLDLPALTERDIAEYCQQLAPTYASAYDLKPPNETVVQAIAQRAVVRWRRENVQATRIAIQSVVAAFDHWRES